MNSCEYANVPQNRERIFIVGFDPSQVTNFNSFSFPSKIELMQKIDSFIDSEISDPKYFYPKEHRYHEVMEKEITNKKTVYQWRRHYVRENKKNLCPTLTANMGTGGHNVPIILTDLGIRKLTPKECLNFQGYPKEYFFPEMAQSKQYKQAGNSVTVPLITAIAKQIEAVLNGQLS